MLWICFSSAESGNLIKVHGKIDAAIRKEMLQENIFLSAELQQDSDLKLWEHKNPTMAQILTPKFDGVWKDESQDESLVKKKKHLLN